MNRRTGQTRVALTAGDQISVIYPARNDLSIGRDETDPVTITYLDGGARVSLIGCTISMAIRWEGDGGGILITSGIDPEIVIEDQADPVTRGQLTINLSPVQRQMIPVGRVAEYQVIRSVSGIGAVDLYGDLVSSSRVNAHA